MGAELRCNHTAFSAELITEAAFLRDYVERKARMRNLGFLDFILLLISVISQDSFQHGHVGFDRK